MARIVSFTVYGKPQQRGSKRALPAGGRPGGRPLMVDDNKHSKVWMEQVRSAAAINYGQELMSGPVNLTCRFYFARPQSHFGTGRNGGILKAIAPQRHTQTPDLSKLMRAVEDALTGVVYRDDRQICQYGNETGKAWTELSARVEITVTELPQEARDAG